MIFFKLYCSFWLFFLSGNASQHNFHSSLAEMNYHTPSKSFQVVIKMFADDTENALTKASGKTYTLKMGKDKTSDKILQSYLETHFILKNKRGKPTPIVYVGKETSVDVVNVYFEMPVSENIKNYTLENTIMLELFDDQTNIVNIQKDNKLKSVQFDSNKKSVQLAYIW
jgi:hypothetical protein